MSEDRYVFGISVDPLRDRQFAFVRVDAVVEERRLRTDVDPVEEFPTEGNIFVAEEFLPDTDVGAIWRVRTATPRSGPRHAVWSAVGRGTPGPIEVISLPISSAQVTGVRQQLLDGVDLGYMAASAVLVRLHDGVIVGPVRGAGYEEDGSYGFRSNHEAFAELLRAWDTTRLDTFHVEAADALDRRRRTFVCDLDLPPSQRWIDFAEFRDTVRSVLKPLTGSDARQLSATHLREISQALRSEDYPENIRERVTRVRRAVQSLSMAKEEIEGLMPVVLASPEFAKELERVRRKAADEERMRIAEEQQRVSAEVRRLRETEQQLREKVASLNQERAATERGVKDAADAAVKEVGARVEEAMENAGKLLADIAVLRPFLAAGTRLGPARSEFNAIPEVPVHPARWAHETEEGESSEPAAAQDLAAQLAGDLKTGGVAANTARVLAREVVAALLAGQVPVFTGSFAATLTEFLSRALAGSRTKIVEIPLGLVSDAPLRDALQAVASPSDSRPPLLVLAGVDRSAIEVYGGVIREAVSKRVLAGDFESVPLNFVAFACGGPACLPIGPGVFDLGPVFDTDLLTYSKKGGGRVPPRTAISASTWDRWRSEPREGNSDTRASTQAACIELSASGSMLWRRGAEVAAGFVAALNDGGDADTAGSVLGRWIVPRALAEGLDPDDIANRLRSLGIAESLIQSVDGVESPIAALLQRARRTRAVGE